MSVAFYLYFKNKAIQLNSLNDYLYTELNATCYIRMFKIHHTTINVHKQILPFKTI